MTKFTNKICSILLVVAMLASMFVMPAFASEDETPAPADVQYAVELLNALGIIDLAYNTDLGASVSRAEFALLLAGFVNSDAIKDIEGISFNDVLPGSYEEDYINTVVSMGYMPPVDDNYFYPAWAITAEDAAVAFLRALGYGSVLAAEKNSALIANRLDLYDGVDVNNFNRGQLYAMMYNALLARVMDQVGVNNNGLVFEQLKDVNGLYYYHDVIRTEGTITGAGGIVLGSGNKAELREDCIELDGNIFLYPNQDTSTLIGRDAYVYWRDIRGSDIENAIYVEIVNDNTLVLPASEIVNYNSLTYEYEVGDKTKQYTANKPYVIYNGEEFTGAYTREYMMPENGDVTIVKADGGRDVIIIRSFEDYIVTAVINDDEKQSIYAKDLNDKTQKFDVGAYEEGSEYYDADGFAMNLSDVKTNSVISVAKSVSGRRHIIYISTETVPGDIVLSDGKTYTIGETEYKLSPAFLAYTTLVPEKAPEIGKVYNFYLNCNGEIAFVDDGASALDDGVFYGIVTGVSTGTGFAETVSVKVYSKTMGGFEIYPVADKLELNGKREDKTKVATALKKKTRDALYSEQDIVAQPVKIGLNAENEVNYLMQSATNNDDGLGFFYFMGSTDPAKTGTYYQYRNVYSYSNQEGGRDFAAAPKDSAYKQVGSATFTEVIQVPFFAPEEGEYMGKVDIESEKAFISTTRPTGVPFVVYKEKDEDLVASFIIRAVEAGEKEHCESTVNVHCILSITEKLVDGEPITCIKTNKMTYYLDDPKINLNALKIWDTLEKADAVVPWIDPATGVQGVHKVVPGDLVNIVADATGFIKAMEIVYDSVNNKMMGKGTGTAASYAYINTDTMWFSRNTQYNLTLLHVLKIEDGYISATDAKDPAEFIADPSTARHYLGAVPPIVCVESNSNGKLTSRNAVNADLIGYYDSPDDHATVILSHRYAQQQGTSFIIKK